MTSAPCTKPPAAGEGPGFDLIFSGSGAYILSSQRKALHAQDVTNLLMVTATVLMALATAFCALASWRMARVSQDFFQGAERPYFGISTIWLDIGNPTEPTSWIQFKNFGSIPADATVIDGSTSIDGRPVLISSIRHGPF